MISSMLEMEGFEVSSAENGVEGLKLIRSSKPDAAIIDLGLPELDGFEVARKLRFGSNEVEPSQSLLIALTGYGQPQDIEKAHECGFDHHMVKPLDPDRLLELLNASAMKQSKSS
jgi:CheY-like chemotaxis protein